MSSLPDSPIPVHPDGLLAGYCQRFGESLAEVAATIARLRQLDRLAARAAADALDNDREHYATLRDLDDHLWAEPRRGESELMPEDDSHRAPAAPARARPEEVVLSLEDL